MFYDNTMFLSQTTSITNLGTKFITSSFNKSMWEALYIIAMKMIFLNSTMETILKNMPKNYPTILIKDIMFKKISINNISKPYV